MRKARFDERLDIVIANALDRLANRMRLAFFRDDLTEYLTRIGLADALPTLPATADFPTAVKKVQGILARRIRRARQKGYLKDYLRQINMTDLLLFKRRVRTFKLWNADKPRVANKTDTDDNKEKPILKIVK